MFCSAEPRSIASRSLSLPRNEGRQLGRRPSFFCAPSGCDNQPMEIVSFGETCLRMRGREGIVATDAYPRIVGPTGRSLTADIVTYSHTDGQQTLGLGSGKKKVTDGQRVPTSLEPAFRLDSPGEFEV